MNKHAKVFKDEAYALLSETESLALQLGANPGNRQLSDRISASFRMIKETSLTFGFIPHISQIA